MNDWRPFDVEKPKNGETVFIWSHYGYDIATYCEGDFYKLEYDTVVGCLRKNCVIHKILSWRYITDIK